MTRFLVTMAAIAVMSTPAWSAPCRNPQGKFVKCPPPAPAKVVRCKDAHGKFAKCGTPGAKPA